MKCPRFPERVGLGGCDRAAVSVGRPAACWAFVVGRAGVAARGVRPARGREASAHAADVRSCQCADLTDAPPSHYDPVMTTLGRALARAAGLIIGLIVLFFLLVILEASGGHDGYLCEWGFDKDGNGTGVTDCA